LKPNERNSGNRGYLWCEEGYGRNIRGREIYQTLTFLDQFLGNRPGVCGAICMRFGVTRRTSASGVKKINLIKPERDGGDA
jgi:hypothetical protein